MQAGLQVGCESAMVRVEVFFGVGGDHDDSPTGEVSECCVVGLDVFEPVVPKGDGRQLFSLRWGIEFSR